MMSEKKKESATNTMKVRFIFTGLIHQFRKHLQVANLLKVIKTQPTAFLKILKLFGLPIYLKVS